MSEVNWIPIADPPKEQFGYFMGALMPVNHEELTVEQINHWREQYGCHKVWLNTLAGEGRQEWWTTSQATGRTEQVNDRITHWAEMPAVPELEVKP